jgi:hypothetical protein
MNEGKAIALYLKVGAIAFWIDNEAFLFYRTSNSLAIWNYTTICNENTKEVSSNGGIIKGIPNITIIAANRIKAVL